MSEWKKLSELPPFGLLVEGKSSDYMGDFIFKCQRIKYKKPPLKSKKMTWRWCNQNGFVCENLPEMWREITTGNIGRRITVVNTSDKPLQVFSPLQGGDCKVIVDGQA